MLSSSTVTAPSLTSSARSSRNYLDARDSRQDALAQALSAGHRATLFMSLNIPGQEKTPPGAEALFSWMLGEIASVFPRRVVLVAACDLLGPYSILGIDGEPESIKRRCVELEALRPSARLVDLDVYAVGGVQVDRAVLGLPGRTCLLCNERAVDCIRSKRHAFEQTIGKVHELLAPFRA